VFVLLLLLVIGVVVIGVVAIGVVGRIDLTGNA